ncbi:MAG: hypothetical protein ACTHVE_01400 [Senegalia sp. (in: firmicutes)]|uniref:hypothetical protein n=1 Tax=Senegalia sp. (in: firmicutes) TaxID=1924098 RepID=UPI003F999F56
MNSFGLTDKLQIKIIGAFMILASVFLFFYLLTPNLNDFLSWILLAYSILLFISGIGLMILKAWSRKIAIISDIIAIIFIVILSVVSIKTYGIRESLTLIFSILIPVVIYSILIDKKIEKLLK